MSNRSQKNIPEDVLAEIRAERDVADLHRPPCRVEIVLGLPGVHRLFVVLPTGATIPLPFSCNPPPFIQDPARYAIKDPATSPTNRWLLATRRTSGGFNADGVARQRCTRSQNTCGRPTNFSPKAYRMGLRHCRRVAPKLILHGFESEIAELPLVLTTTGELVGADESLAGPPFNYTRFGALRHLPASSGSARQHVVAAEVSARAIDILKTRDWTQHLDPDDAINRLSLSPHPPKPAKSGSSYRFCGALSKAISVSDWNYDKRRGLNIIPRSRGEKQTSSRPRA